MQRLSIAILLALALSACALLPAQSPTAQPTITPPTNVPAATAADPTALPPPSAPVKAAGQSVVPRPDWHNLTLTNARTGAAFTLADFEGKVVSIEPMATWCTNCRRQQQTIDTIASQYGDDVVFISLSVGENISDATLAAYAQNEGFDWVFAIATPELLTALVNQFGRTVTTPPSTPHFYIAPDGTTTTLYTGFKSADEFTSTLNGLRGA